MIEKLGSSIGHDGRQVKGDLERFKELIESRGLPEQRRTRRGGPTARHASTVR